MLQPAIIVLAVVLRILKRDWLLVSYVLVPLPLLGIWIAAIDGVGQVLFTAGLRVHQWDRSMVLALLLLSLCAALFLNICFWRELRAETERRPIRFHIG